MAVPDVHPRHGVQGTVRCTLGLRCHVRNTGSPCRKVSVLQHSAHGAATGSARLSLSTPGGHSEGVGRVSFPRGSAPLCAGLRALSRTGEGGGPGSTHPCWCTGPGPCMSLVGPASLGWFPRGPLAGEPLPPGAAFLCAYGGLTSAWRRFWEAQVPSSDQAQPAASFSPHSAFLGVSCAGAAPAAPPGGAGEDKSPSCPEPELTSHLALGSYGGSGLCSPPSG